MNTIQKVPVLLKVTSPMLPHQKSDSSRAANNSGCMAVMRDKTVPLQTLKKGLEPMPPNLSDQLLSFLTLDVPRPRSPVGMQHVTGQLHQMGDHPLSGLSILDCHRKGSEVIASSSISSESWGSFWHRASWFMAWDLGSNSVDFLSQRCHLPTGPSPEPNLSDPVSQSIKEG